MYKDFALNYNIMISHTHLYYNFGQKSYIAHARLDVFHLFETLPRTYEYFETLAIWLYKPSSMYRFSP